MIKKVKYILFWVAILFVILLFKSQLDAFICNHLTLLNYDYIGTKILYIILVIIASILLPSKIKIYNNDYLLNSICIAILYLIFRLDIIKHDDWYYASLFGLIKYTDVLLVVLVILNLYIWLSSKKCTVQTPDTQIPDNNPIESEGEDLFGYYSDAKNLLKVIIQNKSKAGKGAVVIGLQGEWGKGKTSFLNMMRVAASQNDNVILVRINVWMGNYENIAKNLLNTIANSIDDISIKMELRDYSKAIVDADLSYLSMIVSLFKNKTKQIEELFDTVSDRISHLDKIIIVQVDDLDRITKDELLHILKLIRNVANFKNTFFIVAYDPNYINQCFRSLGINDGYLEKIFNIIYPLPAIRKERQISLIKREMSASLLFDGDINGIIEKFMQVIENKISFRNAKRLISSIQCGISGLKDEDGEIMVDSLDYILVQYLGMVNPKAYNFLSALHPQQITYSFTFYDGSINNNGMIYLINKHKGYFMDPIKLTDDEYKEQRLKRDIGEDNIDLSYRILEELFNDDREGIARIKYINSQPLYFNRSFDKRLIGRKKFINSFNAGSEMFIQNLKDWYKNNDRFALARLIANFKCETQKDWINFLEAILNIVPISYTKFQWGNRDRSEIIPSPGLDLITSGTDAAKKIILRDAVGRFFFDKEILKKDSLNILQKKFVLYLFNREMYMKLLSYKMELEVEEINIFKLYWDAYISKGGSYNSFDEDFWYYASRFNFQEKLDIRDILREHIKENINDFMRHYPVPDIVNNPWLHSVFFAYTVSDNGQSSSENQSVWMPYFISFLESIEDKSSELLTYIDKCKFV